MADLALALFWTGVALTGVATVLQLAAALGLGSRVVRGVAATSVGAVTVSERQPLAPALGRLGARVAVVAAVVLVAMLVTRSLATGHPPYSNMFEYLSAFGAGVVLVVAVMERRGAAGRVGPFALPLALVLFLVADLAFSSEIRPLVPALQNNRLLAIHVAAMLISYSIITISGVAALLYLVQGEGNRFAKLPSAAVLQDIAYKTVVAGFPILGLGIALGAYWGNFAWGRYWGWDPKETTALITWLVLAGYLHAHSLSRWRGRRAAWLLLIALGSIVFNIFVVNFVIAGLHSYA